MEEQSSQREFGQRGLGDILNETFVIYGKHFWKFVGLFGIVHVPIGALTVLAPAENDAITVALLIISMIISTFGHGAAIFAVCQHYGVNRVSIGGCYVRVLWRAVTIASMGAALAALLGGALLPFISARTILIPVWVVSALALLVCLVYATTVIPSVVVEGYRGMGAVKRGVNLARNSELHIVWNLIVYALVASGLLLVIMIPFTIFTVVTAVDGEVTTTGQIAIYISQAVVGVVVPPITSIPATLLYYDLRVRKEGFDLEQLTREMGIAAA